QYLSLWVGLNVHEAVGNGIALGEVAKPVGLGRKAGADDPDTLESAGLNQLAPQQEGLDDDVAQIRQFVHGAAQVVRSHLHQPAILDDSAGHQGGAPVDHVD